MGRTGYRIFIYPRGRGKKPAYEIKTRCGSPGCDDDSPHGDFQKAGKVRFHCPEFMFRCHFNEIIKPVLSCIAGLNPECALQSGQDRYWFLRDGRKIQFYEISPPHCRERPAFCEEPYGLIFAEIPFLPEDVGSGKCSVPAEVCFRPGCEPAQAKTSSLPEDKCGFREVLSRATVGIHTGSTGCPGRQTPAGFPCPIRSENASMQKRLCRRDIRCTRIL